MGHLSLGPPMPAWSFSKHFLGKEDKNRRQDPKSAIDVALANRMLILTLSRVFLRGGSRARIPGVIPLTQG